MQAVSPLFDAVGQRTFVVSDDPTAASLVKLSGNFLIASVIESLGEALALVAKAGVDKEQYVESAVGALPAWEAGGRNPAGQSTTPRRPSEPNTGSSIDE